MAGRRAPAALLGLLVAACTAATTPLPPQTVTRAPAPEAAEAAPPPEAAAAPRPPSPPEPRVIEIEPVEPEPEEEPGLVEAARRERERRRQADAPMVVITDANLKEHATGQLTFTESEESAAAEGEAATGEGSAAAPAEAGGEEAEPEGGEVRDEAWWRLRVRTLRQRWRDAADRIPELEQRVADLRQRFYAADDAYYRDSRIKPAWDRAIDQIAQARAEAEAHRLELARVLEEGRRAGALPGWLREGIELEPGAGGPEEARPRRLPEYEPGEPQIYEPDDDGGGDGGR